MIQLQFIPIRHFPSATVSLILHFSWLFPPIISTMLSRETLWMCKCFCRNKRLLTDARTQWLSLGVDMFSIPHVIWLIRVSGDYNMIAELELRLRSFQSIVRDLRFRKYYLVWESLWNLKKLWSIFKTTLYRLLLWVWSELFTYGMTSTGVKLADDYM